MPLCPMNSPTTENYDGNSNADNRQANTITEPVKPDGQAGLSLSYDDDKLTAEEAQDLINQYHIEDSGQGSNKDNSQPVNGMVAISKA